MKILRPKIFLLLALVALAGSFSGCATTDPDNASVRPWNSAEGWDSGALGGLNYQHR